MGCTDCPLKRKMYIFNRSQGFMALYFVIFRCMFFKLNVMIKVSRICCILWLLITCYSCDSQKPKEDIVQQIPLAGLVAHIPFNGTATERISNTTGTVVKATYVSDRKGFPASAVHFNRTDSAFVDFGDLETVSFPNGAFSISCWVNPEDTVLPGAILSKRLPGGPFEYSLDNHFWGKSAYTFDNWVMSGSGTVYGIDPLQAKSPVHVQRWQHIVYVANGEQLRVYTNGVLQQGIDMKQTGLFSNTYAPLVVGNGGGFQKHYYMQGAIDDIRIYNRVLSEQEVQWLFAE